MRGIVFTKPNFLKNLFKKGRPKFDIRKNAMFLLLCLFLLIGIIAGVICARNGDKSLVEKLNFLFLTDFKNRRSMDLLSVFSASFSSNFLMLLATFLLGISAWGFFVLPAVPLFKGFGFGISTGYMYAAYGAAGVFYNILVVLLGAFVSAFILIIISKESFRFSWNIMTSLRGYKSDISEEFSLYIVRVFWALIALAGASLLDMLCSLIFSGLFSFS